MKANELPSSPQLQVQNSAPLSPLEPLLKIGDLVTFLGIGKSTIYDNIKAGRFPAPVHITPSAARWRRSDIEAWLTAKVGGK